MALLYMGQKGGDPFALAQLAQIYFQNCDLLRANDLFGHAWELIQNQHQLTISQKNQIPLNPQELDKALGVFAQYILCAQQQLQTEFLEIELNHFLKPLADFLPAKAWLCRGLLVAAESDTYHAGARALRFYRTYLRALSTQRNTHTNDTEDRIFGLTMIAKSLFTMGCRRQSMRLAKQLIAYLKAHHLSHSSHGLLGQLSLLCGQIEEHSDNRIGAWKYYRQAHSCLIGDHCWFDHLDALLGYARLCRKDDNNISGSKFYLDVIEGSLRNQPAYRLLDLVRLERNKLESQSVDLAIDFEQGLVRTREQGDIVIGKQYVLLSILRALSKAHLQAQDSAQQGLTKAQLVAEVWRQPYYSAAHDNKLYYNINRLRRVIEPNHTSPRYLLKHRDGYRFAPGLKVVIRELGNQKQG